MPSNLLHPMLNVAIKAARAAGAIINRGALDVESVRVAQKHVNDFVTEIDRESERVVIETLLTAYPGHGILAEESGSQHGAKDSEFVWIIDPLDGTTNFIHGYPFYCVSIALAVRGKVEQAVIYEPIRNDLFTATKGRGAYLNERRIRVSKRTRLAECLVTTGFPFRAEDSLGQFLAMTADLIPRSAGQRRSGSAALDLAYVAAGASDAFVQAGLSPWDAAAGSLLVTEAGGLVGNLTGDADFLHQQECLAANPRIYAQLVQLLGRYSKFASVDDKLQAGDRVRQTADRVAASQPAVAESAHDATLQTSPGGAGAGEVSVALTRTLTRKRPAAETNADDGGSADRPANLAGD